MGKRIAIVTGASGGLGKEFVKLMLQEDLDVIWAIARNQEKLKELKQELGNRVLIFSRDLTKSEQVHSIKELLLDQSPEIVYLVNNAGIGKMGTYQDFSVEEIEATIAINCSAVAALCALCIPYMKQGSRILNISSQASFQPVAYINLYAATKAFVRSYSRALNLELKSTGITVTAVCPGWVDTDLLRKESNGEPIKFPALVTAKRVADKAMKDAKRGKDMSVCTLFVKSMHLFVKIVPQKMAMQSYARSLQKYLE